MYQIIKTLHFRQTQSVYDLDFSPDNRELLVGQRGFKGRPNLTRWSVPELELLDSIIEEDSRNILTARYLPEAERIVYVLPGEMPKVFDLSNRNTVEINLPDSSPHWLRPAKAANRLVMVGERIYVWDIHQSGVIWENSSFEGGKVRPVATLNYTGDEIAVAGTGNPIVSMHSVNEVSSGYELSDAPAAVRQIEIDPGHRFLALVEQFAKGLFVWELGKRQSHLPRIFNEKLASIWSICFHPSGDYLICGNLIGFVMIFQLADGAIIMDERPHQGRVWAVSCSPNGRYLATGGDDGSVHLWELIP